MLDLLSSPQAWLALLTLSALEIVLGVDNLIFISAIAARLPPRRQAVARRIGLALALVIRLGLLALAAWITRLTTPIMAPLGHPLSWRDLILIAGGFFLIFSSTREIHGEIEGDAPRGAGHGASSAFAAVVAQIVLLDVVFSLDSLITAVGMAREFWVMVVAVVIAVGIMLAASGPIVRFIHAHPTVKMLALAFVLLIGFAMVAEGFEVHIPKGYIYAAIGFSIGVEIINQLAARRTGTDRSRGACCPIFHSARRNPWEESTMLRTPRRYRSMR